MLQRVTLLSYECSVCHFRKKSCADKHCVGIDNRQGISSKGADLNSVEHSEQLAVAKLTFKQAYQQHSTDDDLPKLLDDNCLRRHQKAVALNEVVL